MFPESLSGVIIPVVAATIILVGGAWVVRAYAGPAQTAYVSAVEGRMKTLAAERDDLSASLDRLNEEVVELRGTVADLERTVARLEKQVRDLTMENIELMRAARAAK